MSRKATHVGMMGVLATAILCLLGGSDSHVLAGEAQTPPTPTPATVVDPIAKVRAVLEARCASCRERASESGSLNLDELARDPSLVWPKQPDASRAYQDLLAHRPAQVASAGAAAGASTATPDEIDAVREWIETLPALADLCRERKPVTAEAAASYMKGWLAAVGPEAAADTRFLSLAHLYNTCSSEHALAAYRSAVADAIAAIAHRTSAPAIDTVGDESAILAVRLSEIGVTPEQWDNLATELAPDFGHALPADAVAAAAEKPSDATATARVKALAQVWQRDVDLARAGAEFGLEPAAFEDKLLAVDGEFEAAAHRLVRATISRPAWTALRRHLAGETPLPPDTTASKPSTRERIDVGVWTDKPVYKAGDLISIAVTVDLACHLTLVSIDRDGKAIVLYPNDGDPNNLIAPGVIVRVPSAQAGYQFRVDRAGQETIVAQCRRTASLMDGVLVDYEKQRFTILGDWRAFLKTAAARETEIKQQSGAKRSRHRNRDKNGDDPPPAVDPNGPDIEGRSAVTMTIEP